MELYIIRHSVAHYVGEDGARTDNDRTLTHGGVERAKLVGKGLAQLGIRPSLVLVSPAVRTQETAKHIFGQMNLPDGTLQTEPALGTDASSGGVIAMLDKRANGHQRVAIVGHEPTMGNLISLLLCGAPYISVKVGRASVTRIDIAGSVEPNHGQLVWKMHAKHLAAIAGHTLED